MKKCIILLLAIMFIGACGCSKSSSNKNLSVPDSMIYEYHAQEYEDFTITEIIHNYDPETHIDHVTVVAKLEAETESKIIEGDTTYLIKYQYYASDDIWSFINAEEISYHMKEMAK